MRDPTDSSTAEMKRALANHGPLMATVHNISIS